MLNWKQNNWLTVLGTFSLLILTYFRENLLLTINAFITGSEYNRAYSYWFSDVFVGLSMTSLIKLKWIITIVFSMAMSVITVYSLSVWFTSKYNFKLISYIYIISFIFILVLAFFGKVFGVFDLVYILLRRILGVIQTPLPFFTFFIVFYWMDKNSNL